MSELYEVTHLSWKKIRKIMCCPKLLQNPYEVLSVMARSGYIIDSGNPRLHFNYGYLNMQRQISRVCLDQLEQFPYININYKNLSGDMYTLNGEQPFPYDVLIYPNRK